MAWKGALIFTKSHMQLHLSGDGRKEVKLKAQSMHAAKIIAVARKLNKVQMVAINILKKLICSM